jgi:hypothetical protein
VTRLLLRWLFTFCVSAAACSLLLLASSVGEANRCHRLDPSSNAHAIYCEAGR